MVRRDPHLVLGVEPGASAATIKAAWRRLAREHHPDLAADPAAARRATRRMAEINAAYEALRDRARPGRAGRTGPTAARRAGGEASGSHADGGDSAARPRYSPRRERPVTGRLDTTATFHVRNHTTTPPGAFGTGPLPGQPPPPRPLEEREPPRASDPTGPLQRRRARRRRDVPPALTDACAVPLEFGKFHGHTLGEVAAFEPSYIDWIVRTIARDPALVAAARVVQADMDERGVRRRSRVDREAPIA